MYYDLYIDVLFLVNFMMDYLLLLTTKKILKCSATHLNVCIGALLGSLATCIIVSIPIPYVFVKFILFHAVVNTGMIWIGLRMREWKRFFKAFLMLYISGFLLGGVMTYLRQYVRMGSLFFAIAVGSYYIVQGIWNMILRVQRINKYRCQVKLYLGEEVYCVEAVIDTGNMLTDPVTKKPVCLVEQSVMNLSAEKLMDSGLRYISYQSLGCKNGVLPLIRLDKMCVRREEDYWIADPLIAMSENMLSTGGEYKMILNPDVF